METKAGHCGNKYVLLDVQLVNCTKHTQRPKCPALCPRQLSYHPVVLTWLLSQKIMHRAYLPELFMFALCCVLSVKASWVCPHKQFCDKNSGDEVSRIYFHVKRWRKRISRKKRNEKEMRSTFNSMIFCGDLQPLTMLLCGCRPLPL